MSYIFEEVTGTAGALSFKFNGQFALKNYNVEIVNGNRLKVVSTSNEMFSLLEADVSEVEINGTVYSDPNAAQLALTSLVYSDAEPVVLTKEQYIRLAAAVQAADRGTISPTTPVPVEGWQAGWYKPNTSSSDPGTNYPNQNNLKSIQGFINRFYYDGTNWAVVREEIQNITNVTNNFDFDPDQIIPAEALYEDGSVAVDIEKRVDSSSGVDQNYRKTTTWYDGSPVTDAKCDDDIFKKNADGSYSRKTIKRKTFLKFESIYDLRSSNGYYEGQEVILTGYYEAGDKKPLTYKFTINNFDTLMDDGGSIIKSSRGAWIAKFNGQINVKDFGMTDGPNDNSTAVLRLNAFLAAIAPTVENMRYNLYFPPSKDYYRSTSALMIPAYISVDMTDGCFMYTGTPNVTALTVGTPSRVNIRTKLILNVRSEVVSWVNPTYEGIRVINLNSSTNLNIVQATGFYFGFVGIGDAGGFSYNTLNLGQIGNNKYNIKLTNKGNGWINQNMCLGGRIYRFGSVNPGQDNYGVIITSEDGNYINNNNNTFIGTSFELAYNGVGETIPIIIEHGVQNEFSAIRIETGNIPCIVKTLNFSADNLVNIGFLSTVGYNYNAAVRDEGSYPTTLTSSRRGGVNQHAVKYPVFVSGDLIKRVFTPDNIQVYAPDEMFFCNSGNATNVKTMGTGVNIVTSAVPNLPGHVLMNTTRGIGVKVDTSKNKRFIINKHILTGGLPGRVMIRCYGAAGNILTNVDSNGSPKVYVRGEATAPPAYHTSYGGCYRMGSDADTNFYINVDQDVKAIDVIVGGGGDSIQLISFSIGALDFPCSVINPYNKTGWYSSSVPTTTIYEPGTEVKNSNAAATLLGWKYTGSAWVESNPVVPNASTTIKGIVNQSAAVMDVAAANATDLPTALTLINELKAKLNAMLASERSAGQRNT